MLATLLEILKGLVGLGPILEKYFPPKSTESTVEKDQAAIAKRLDNEQKTGRPQ